MNTIHRQLLGAALIAALFSAPLMAQPQGAQIIFSSDKLTIIDAKGVERSVKQGDFIQPGERLLTPPGAMSQLRLHDGTLLGVRPGSDIRLEAFDSALAKNVITLNEGKLRVINVEQPGGGQPLPTEIATPASRLLITGGDGESIHIRSGGPSGVQPGTYNRLQLGSAIIQNPSGNLLLRPLDSSFVPRPGVLPQPIDMLPPTLARLDPITIQPGSTLQTGTGSISPEIAGRLTTLGPVAPSGTGIGSTPLLIGGQTSGRTITYNNVQLGSGAISTVPLTTIKTVVTLRPPPPPPAPPPPKYIIRRF